MRSLPCFQRFVISTEGRARGRSGEICGTPALTRTRNYRANTTLSRLGISALIAFCAALASAQDFSASSRPQESRAEKSDVTFLFPEQVTVPARQSTAVDLHFRVADGLHINSHTPREKSFIPTNLAVIEGNGVKVAAVDFPPGTDYALSFSPNEKLSVYTGDFVLKAHLTAQPGEHLLQGALRYQACNSNSCYPPKTIPVAVSVIAK